MVMPLLFQVTRLSSKRVLRKACRINSNAKERVVWQGGQRRACVVPTIPRHCHPERWHASAFARGTTADKVALPTLRHFLCVARWIASLALAMTWLDHPRFSKNPPSVTTLPVI